MRPFFAPALVAACLLATACGQKIVVIDCDASHDGATSVGTDGLKSKPNDAGMTPNGDTGTPGGSDGGGQGSDGGTGGNDTGSGGEDAGTHDTGAIDTGTASCATAPYCIHDLATTTPKVNVRQAVMFTPMIDNAGGATLSFSVDKSEIVAVRRAELPAANL